MASKYIRKYYEISDPIRRLKYLEKSIELGEEPEANAARKEIWDVRYSKKASHDKNQRADGLMGLWMQMEFLKGNLKGFFGMKGAKRDMAKMLKSLKFEEFQSRGELYRELLYLECEQLVRSYCELAGADKNYNTYLLGLVHMSDEVSEAKLLKDLRTTGIEFPAEVGMEKELELIVRATRKVLDEKNEEIDEQNGLDDEDDDL